MPLGLRAVRPWNRNTSDEPICEPKNTCRPFRSKTNSRERNVRRLYFKERFWDFLAGEFGQRKREASSNWCLTGSNRCLASSNKKLVQESNIFLRAQDSSHGSAEYVPGGRRRSRGLWKKGQSFRSCWIPQTLSGNKASGPIRKEIHLEHDMTTSANNASPKQELRITM